MNKTPLWTKDFLGISFGSFFLFTGFYILLTTLPLYVLDELKGDASEVGLVVSIFLIAAVLCRPFTGKWVDDIGRKPILLLATGIFFLATIGYFFTNSVTALLIIRFIHGIGFGMATTATGTIAADIIPAERKGEGLGYYGMFMNLAMVIGPYVGLTFIHLWGFNVIIIVCTVMSALAFLLSSLLNIPRKVKQEKVHKEKVTLASFFEKKALPVSIVAAIFSFAYAGILSFISVFAKDLGLITAASYFFVVYAGFILISRPFTGKWFDIFGENKIIYPGIILFALGLYLLSQANSTLIFLLSGAIIGLGYGTLAPSFQTIVVKNAPEHRRGLATATFFTLFDTGIGLGSYILGIIASNAGYQKLYLTLVGVVLLGLVFYYFLHGKKSAKINLTYQNKPQQN